MFVSVCGMRRVCHVVVLCRLVFLFCFFFLVIIRELDTVSLHTATHTRKHGWREQILYTISPETFCQLRMYSFILSSQFIATCSVTKLLWWLWRFYLAWQFGKSHTHSHTHSHIVHRTTAEKLLHTSWLGSHLSHGKLFGFATNLPIMKIAHRTDSVQFLIPGFASNDH